MKRVIFSLVISLFFSICYSQSEDSKTLLGSWYHCGNSNINLNIDETISFTKESSDSLKLEWLFKENGDFTIRLAMLTPDEKDVIKYKSKSANWILHNESNELIIENESQSQVLKIKTLDIDRLTVTRIK
ncbi:MAG: hypothetical protein ABFS32_20640 [Bacteroidota bacterium]